MKREGATEFTQFPCNQRCPNRKPRRGTGYGDFSTFCKFAPARTAQLSSPVYDVRLGRSGQERPWRESVLGFRGRFGKEGAQDRPHAVSRHTCELAAHLLAVTSRAPNKGQPTLSHAPRATDGSLIRNCPDDARAKPGPGTTQCSMDHSIWGWGLGLAGGPFFLLFSSFRTWD